MEGAHDEQPTGAGTRRLRSVEEPGGQTRAGDQALSGTTLVPLDSALVRQLESWGEHLLLPTSVLLKAAARAYLDRLERGPEDRP